MTTKSATSIGIIFILTFFSFLSINGQENHKTVRGKYLGGSLNGIEFTNIKIKSRHVFVLHKFTDSGKLTQVVKGTWTLKGSELTLTPKYDLKAPSLKKRLFKRKSVTVDPSSKQIVLVLQKGKWYDIAEREYTFDAVYTQYKRSGLYYKQRDWEESSISNNLH